MAQVHYLRTLSRTSIACASLVLVCGSPLLAAPDANGRVVRTEVQRDTLNLREPWMGVLTSGRHSQIAVGPDGRVAVVWSGVRNIYHPSFLQVVTFGPDWRGDREALSTLAPPETAVGRPIGLAWAGPGDLWIAAGRGQYADGIDVWRRHADAWRVETVGGEAVSRASGVDLLLGRGGRAMIVAGLRAAAAQPGSFSGSLAVFSRADDGTWRQDAPVELGDAVRPLFSAVALPDGGIAVVYAHKTGRLVCGLRAADGRWRQETVHEGQAIDHPAATVGPDGRLVVAFAAKDAAGATALWLATRGNDGVWHARELAEAGAGRGIGGVDVARLADRTLVAWNPRPVPDRDGAEGDLRLAIVADAQPEAVESIDVATNHGRPSLAVDEAGTIAFVGGRAGDPDGQDFTLFTVALGQAPAAGVSLPALEPARLERQAVGHELASGNAEAARRALATIAAKKLAGFGAAILAFAHGHADPADRVLAIRALGETDATAELTEILPAAVESNDPALRRAAAAYLGALGPGPRPIALLRDMLARPEFEASDDRRAAADGVASLASHPAAGGDAACGELVWESLTAAPADVRRLTAQALGRRQALATQGAAWDGLVARLASRLLETMGTGSRSERFVAREQLLSLADPRIETALRQALESPDLGLRARAASVLSRMRKLGDATPLVAVFAEGVDEAVQGEAVEAIEFSWPAGAEAALAAALRQGTPWTRVKAAVALRAIGGMFEKPKTSAEEGPPIASPERQAAARTALATGLDDDDSQVLAHVIDALGALEHRPALDRIRRFVGHADARVRRAAATAAALLGDPVRIGSERMLLIDDFAIDRLDGLRRSVRPAAKHPANPVIKGDAAWEFDNAYVYGAVIHDPDERLYKAWYKANTHKTPSDARNPGYQIRILYARSRDGVVWEKPDLGLDPLADGRNNVIWNNVDLMNVWKDIREPDPARRYKAVYRDIAGDTRALGVADMDSLSRDDKTKVNHTLARLNGHVGYGFATSPDGIRWTPSPNNPVLREEAWRDGETADVINGFWDDSAGLFRLYCKTMSDERSVAYTESPDGLRWTAPNVVLPAPKYVRDVEGRTIRNRQVHYGMGVTPYEGMYVGLLWIFRMYDDWSVDVILATSRDGVKWQRCSDESPFIPRTGIHKAWDGGQVYSASHFLVVGDEIRVYYAGGFGPHNAAQTMGSGLATLQRDRFAAIHVAPGNERGTLTTKPLLFDGTGLTVNVLAGRGSVRVEVLDAAGLVVPGFEATACAPVTGDHLDAPVTWRAATLETLRNKPVRLRFIVEGDADLHSFGIR